MTLHEAVSNDKNVEIKIIHNIVNRAEAGGPKQRSINYVQRKYVLKTEVSLFKEKYLYLTPKSRRQSYQSSCRS